MTISIGMRMVRIEPGTFRMGRTLSRDTWEEQPAHDVVVSTPSSAPCAAGVGCDEARALAEGATRFDTGRCSAGRHSSFALLKAESSWKGFRDQGTARRWNEAGELVAENEFREGVPVPQTGGAADP